MGQVDEHVTRSAAPIRLSGFSARGASTTVMYLHNALRFMARSEEKTAGMWSDGPVPVLSFPSCAALHRPGQRDKRKASFAQEASITVTSSHDMYKHTGSVPSDPLPAHAGSGLIAAAVRFPQGAISFP